ncbi:MAG TPA: DNA polymerase III subunit delta, partial [Paenibacillaceae bacterium]|nr:DNA polymerase III subunit delta [Paenibacillaceae bacterium]
LILVIPGEKPDERKKVVKELKKQGVCIDFQPLREGDLFSWIQREVKKNKVDIQTEAVTALLDLIGNDLRSIQQELSKMTLYVGEGGTITSEVVHLLASRHIDQNIFQLVEYAARKDIEKALREYYDLLLNKEEPIKILVLLARQFRILLQIKIMGDRGYSPQQITQSIGLKPFVFKKAYDQ